MRSLLYIPLLTTLTGLLDARSVWLRLTSPGFELYTDAGEKTGREVLQRFEQIHHAAPQGGVQLPVRVYVFSSESEWRDYRSNSVTTGFYQSAPERDYIAMRYSGAQTYRVVFHEYIHLLLNHIAAPLPFWAEEGTAELYSTLDFSNGLVRVGDTIPAHLETLRNSRWLTAGELRAVTLQSPYYNEKTKAGIFYAQSWALVHMLNLDPRFREAYPRFTASLAEGAEQGAAFDRSFGKTLEQALEDLRDYVQQRWFEHRQFEVASSNPAAIRVEELSASNASLARAELLLSTGHASQAEKIYQRLERETSSKTALAAVAISRRDWDGARAYLEQALQLGGAEAATYFEYAMLLRDSGHDNAEVDRNLRKAIALDDNFAEAHFILALRLPAAESVGHLLKATAIFPRRSYFWHALAYAYHQLGDQALASGAARRALDAAVNNHDVEMAQAAIRLAETLPSAAVNRPSVTVPKSWQNRVGDSRLEGTIERLDCLGETARLHVRVKDRDVAFSVSKPSEIVLKSSSAIAFEFQCGPQAARTVGIEYIAASDGNTVGEITAIEFK